MFEVGILKMNLEKYSHCGYFYDEEIASLV